MRRLIVFAVALAASGAFAQYDNTFNYSGYVFSNGGAALVTGAGNTTKYVADDINFDAKWLGKPLRFIGFAVSNGNATSIQFRPRVRFHQPDSTNPAGGPKTYITGFSWSGLVTLGANAGGSYRIYFTGTSPVTIPAFTSMWMGLTFDTNNGASAATIAEMNNLRQYLYSPPFNGTSQDKMWSSNAASIGNVTHADGSGATVTFTNTPASSYFFLNAGRFLQGSLQLQNWPSARFEEETITCKIYDATDTLVDTENLYLSSTGDYTFYSPVMTGTCSLVFKGRTWLSKKIVGVDMSGDHTAVPTNPWHAGFNPLAALDPITLLNGDVDGDDVVSVFDYIALSDAFDSVADQDSDPLTIDPSPNWNVNADLDGDEAVSVFDYIILSDNFDLAGDTVP